ncbi:MAG: glycerol kinase GlpK [Pseudomonadota bacterium]
MDKTIIAIDQGTTSTRAILFSTQGEVRHIAQKELQLHYPQRGWVEQDAQAIWADTEACLAQILRAAGPDRSLAIGITNQRETIVVWDRATGQPIYNAIIWQDQRGADHCAMLRQAGHEDMVTDRTGLLLDSYFTATKLAWMLDNVPGARQRAVQGDLCAGTIDSWLVWHLTRGQNHVTDATNASRTLLYNIRTHDWDDDLLKLFDIPRAILPTVQDNAGDFGLAHLPDGTTLPITGMAGDQQAALIGQACIAPGMMKSTYGTGCFALVNIGQDFQKSANRLLTTVAYRLNGQGTYALEGSIYVAGAAFQWLRDGLKAFESAGESEALARSVADTGGVVFVPAFTGLGAPYWDPHARAALMGMTRDTTLAHITRAACEAQALQTHDLMTAMAADMGAPVTRLRADGGLVSNKLVCQMLADIMGIPIDVPRVTETTAMGAAFLAALGCGYYRDLSDVTGMWQRGASYAPDIKPAARDEKLALWRDAVSRVLTK